MSKSLRNTLIIGSALYLFMGLSLIIWPSVSKLIICYVLGAVLFFAGAVRVIVYFSSKQMGLPLKFDFILGALGVVLGLVFLFKPQTIVAAFGVIIGIAVVIDSLIKLQFSLELRRIGSKHWLRSLITALFTLVLGVIFVFNPFAVSDALTIVTGVVLILDGIANALCLFDVSHLPR